MCVPVNKTGLASLLAPIRSLKCGQRTALEHTSADFLLQQVQGPRASRELAEFTALEFLGPNKLRRQCPARGTEACDPLAREGKGWMWGAGWGCDGLGREQPEPGAVRGLPGPAGGSQRGWRQ